jgi:hypothetical protein
VYLSNAEIETPNQEKPARSATQNLEFTMMPEAVSKVVDESKENKNKGEGKK